MKPEVFLENIDLVSEASNGIESLRAYIFQLAIEGNLVEQVPGEESAEILLSKIKSEKEKLIKHGKLKKSKNEPVVVAQGETLPKGWVLTCLDELGLVNPRNSLGDSLEVSFIPMKLIPEGFSGEASFEVGKWNDVKGGFTHIASNDVVMAKITPCFQNRKSVVLKNLKNGFGAGTTELHVFRAIPNTVVPEYVLLFLKSANFINIGIPKMTGSAGQKRVPNDYFSFTPIPLPPREEQKRIVAKVDQLMALCDELEAKQEKQTHTRRQLNDAALNALLSAASPDEFENHWQRIIDNFDLLYDDLDNLQNLRRSVWQLAIQGTLTALWRKENKSLISGENHPWKILEKIKLEKAKKALDGKVKNENLQESTYSSRIAVPSDWVLCNLIDLCKQITDGTHQTPTYVENGEIFLSAQNVKPFRFIPDNHRFVSKTDFETIRKNRIPEKGDLLVARVGAGIGEAAVIDQDIVCLCTK